MTLWCLFIPFPIVQQPTADQDLSTDYWSHVHLLGVKGEWSSSQYKSEVWSTWQIPQVLLDSSPIGDVVQLLGSVVILLPSDQEVPGSIPGSTMG